MATTCGRTKGSSMSAVLVIALILLLAVALVALGLGLSRRAQKHEGEAPPPRGGVITEPPPAPPPATASAPDVVVEPEVVAAPEPEVLEREALEAPSLRDRLGQARAAVVRLLAACRGRGRGAGDKWGGTEECE